MWVRHRVARLTLRLDLRPPEPVPHPTVRMPTNGFRPQEMQRREFQRATANAVDQHAAILKDIMAALSKHALDASTSREFVADLSMRVDQHHEEARGVYADHARALTEVRNDFYCRSFLGRLRWLLIGR